MIGRGADEKMKKAYLIHGTSLPDDDWFPWLKKTARQKLNCTVKIVDLPQPFSPHPSEWDAACDRSIVATDGVTIIAHSLGCIEALRFIEQHDVQQANLILVSGFDEPIYTYPELNSFADHTFNYARDILPKVANAVVVTAKDDRIVPTQFSQTMAQHLRAKLILQSTGGHFLGDAGYTKLPVVLEELERVMA